MSKECKVHFNLNTLHDVHSFEDSTAVCGVVKNARSRCMMTIIVVMMTALERH